jgi:alkane 1-monooxygenase
MAALICPSDDGQNAAHAPSAPVRLRGFAGFAPHLVPHLVFFALIVLCLADPGVISRAAFWSWVALLVADESLAVWLRSKRPDIAGGPALNSAGSVWLVRSVAPLFLLFLAAAAHAAVQPDVQWPDFLSLAVSCGFAGAVFAIPAAHELMHGRSRADTVLAVLMMAAFSYPHFCVEHVFGHHRNVGTPRDPATARRGEDVYSFFQRSIHDGFVDAWRIERARRARRGGSLLGDRILLGWLVVVGLYGACFFFLGLGGVAFLAVQALIGVFTLATINYVQHYGLERGVMANGVREPVSDAHSWNSRHALTNWALLNLARHSDHHVEGTRGFERLRDRGGAPTLPFGYFGILWLALFPPLWRALMDRRVAALQPALQAASRERPGGGMQ